MLGIRQSWLKRTSITSSLLDTGAYSDLVIGCKDREWKVHKAIVLLSSKTLDDKFKATGGDHLSFDEDQPEIVEHMLDFLYNEDYCDHYESEGWLNALLTNALVYIMARKYSITRLQDHSLRKYDEVMPEGWNSYPFIESLRILYDNDQHSDEILKGVSVNAIMELEKGPGGENGDVALNVLSALLTNGQRKQNQPTLSSASAVWNCQHCRRVYY